MKLDRMLASALGVTLAIAGCSRPQCNAICGPCEESFVARVTLTGGGSGVEIDGTPCAEGGTVFVCSVSPGVGARTVLIRAPGFVTSSESVITTPPPDGCCTCSPQITRNVTLRPDGTDAGARDAGIPDASTPPTDAGRDTGPLVDTGTATCDESQVRFRPEGGRLVVDQLCDDVFACAAGAAEAARILAAAPSFTCDPTPEGPCTAITCVLRPSTLDANEIAEICALTVLRPTPELACFVYL